MEDIWLVIDLFVRFAILLPLSGGIWKVSYFWDARLLCSIVEGIVTLVSSCTPDTCSLWPVGHALDRYKSLI